MKKIFVAVLFAMLIFSVAPVLAVKPAGNFASAQKVEWFLSSEVMRFRLMEAETFQVATRLQS